MRFTDFLERVGSTAVEVFLMTWLVLQSQGGGYDVIALQACGMAAAVSVAKYVATANLNITGDNAALKVLERITWTAVAAFAGTWLTLEARGDGWNASFVLKVAGGAAVAAAVKSVLALNIGNHASPAVLPASLDA